MYDLITSFASSLSISSVVLVLLAGAFTIYAYATYFSHTRHEVIKPNPWSWTIWGVTTLVEALTYNAVSESFIQSLVFYVSALCCFAVSIAVWRYGNPRWPTLTDWFCIVASATALILWLMFHQEWWAHLITVVAVPISFIPIWAETWNQPEQERAGPWVWWSIGDFFTLVLILSLFQGNERELPYIIAEFACHFGMLLIVIGRQSKGKRKIRDFFSGPLMWESK